MFKAYERLVSSIRTAASMTKTLPKIYAIGRIKGETRKRFGVTSNTLTELDLLIPDMPPIRACEYRGYRYDYVGPYTVSCDHRCSHLPYKGADGVTNDKARGTGSHGSAFSECTPSASSWSMTDVYQRSILGIALADHVFVWLDDFEAYGSLVEVGYARALNKPIFFTHAPHIDPKDELWFALQTALVVKSFESGREAYGWFLQLVGQPAKPAG